MKKKCSEWSSFLQITGPIVTLAVVSIRDVSVEWSSEFYEGAQLLHVEHSHGINVDAFDFCLLSVGVLSLFWPGSWAVARGKVKR